MKKIVITIALFLAIAGTAAAQKNVSVTKEGKTFTATRNATAGSEKGYKPTGYTYVDTDGNAYEIHIHTVQKGEHAGETRCYIRRTSKKTGKPYWKIIPVKPEELKEE